MKRILTIVLCCALTAGLCSCRKVGEETAETTGSAGYESVPGQADEFVSPVYASLDREEQAVYDRIKTAVEGFKDAAYFDPPIPRDTARKLYRLVYAQERQYFWLSSLFYAPDDQVSVLRLNYLYEKDDAELKRAELDFAVSTIMGELPEDATDFDKVVYFHDRIVTGCDFDDSNEHAKSAYGVLAVGYGQCEGYAAAMAALLDAAGIPGFMVTGTNAEGATHAWNKVLLDGKWYNVDCTWDDPIIKRDNPDFVRHDYLLVTDDEIEGKTHFIDDLYKGLVVCDSDDMNYFVQKGLLFSSAADGLAAFSEQVKAAGLAGKREAEIRFSGEDAYYAAMARLFDSGEIKDIIEDINGNCGTRIKSAYKHNNDELRIVHISLIYESDPDPE